jgi:hypothetical protein
MRGCRCDCAFRDHFQRRCVLIDERGVVEHVAFKRWLQHGGAAEAERDQTVGESAVVREAFEGDAVAVVIALCAATKHARSLFSTFPVCLSRACLGKMIVF